MKKILIFATVLIIILVGGAIYYFKWRHNFIRQELPQLVFLKSDSLYQISYGDVYIDEVNGEISIDNVLLRPDTAHQNDPGDRLPRKLLEVSIPRLHMTGLHTDKAVLNEQVVARKLQLTRPVVTLYDNNGDAEAKKEKKVKTPYSSHELYKAILRNLLRIKIDTILIDSARYNMVRWKTRDTVLTGSYVNVFLHNLDISDSTSTDTSRILFAKKAVLNFDRMKIMNESGLYVYRFTAVELNSVEKTLAIKNMSIDPSVSESEFARSRGTEGDRFDISFTGVKFTKIDVEEVLGGNLVADNLVVKEGIWKIYRDKNYPGKNVSKIGRYPHQLLMRAPIAMSLGKVNINGGYIEYKEKSNLTGNTGKIRFHNTAISITNFTNRPADLKQNPATVIALRAQFLDVIPLTVNLRLYPADQNGKFTASGSLGAADAMVFNQLTTPLGLANIESGKLISCGFQINGNDHGSSGTVKMLYNGLKVKLLEKDAATGEFKPKKFASFLANAALKDENPKKNRPVRIAHINYRRNPYKGFFNLLWKSIFTGVQQTVGIEAKDVAVVKMDNR